MYRRRTYHLSQPAPPGGGAGGLSWPAAIAITIPLLLALVFKDHTAAALRSVVSGGGPPRLQAAHAELAVVTSAVVIDGDSALGVVAPDEAAAGGSANTRGGLKAKRRQPGEPAPSPRSDGLLGAEGTGAEDGEEAAAVLVPPPTPPAATAPVGGRQHELRPGEAPPPTPPSSATRSRAPSPPPPSASSSVAASASGSPAPPSPAAEAYRDPVNAILIAAPGTRVFPELARTLVSVSRNVPNAVVVLLVRGEEAAALIPHIAVPGLDPPGSPPAGKIALHLRMYNWDYFDGRLPEDVRGRFPSIKRYNVYPAVLDDLANGGRLAETAPDSVFFTNVPPAMLRRPDGVMLSDGRDVVFQRDPFAEMWARASSKAAAAAVRAGRSADDSPGRGTAWAPGLQAFKYLLAAQEARVMRIEEEDWNRSWVHYCFYYLGEEMVDKKWILCSGTTLGTVDGVLAYLQKGMNVAANMCDQIGWEKGMDQGIHNVLLQDYTREDWVAIEAKHEPRFDGERKDALLTLVRSLQAELVVDRTPSEDGLICTMALQLKMGVTKNGEGDVTKHNDPSLPCAVVHQVDRDGSLEMHYASKYRMPGTL